MLELFYTPTMPEGAEYAGWMAYQYGHVEMLEWMEDKHWVPALVNENVFSVAGDGGHIEVLKWMLNNIRGCQRQSEICEHLAMRGHLETLKWARKKGFIWNSETTEGAAFHQRKETFVWAVENGCPYHPKKFFFDPVFLTEEMRDWLIEKGYGPKKIEE